MSDMKKRIIQLLDAIPDLSELTMNPSIFSDDIDKHDCDNCESSILNAGDTYDEDVCRSCWIIAIEKEEGSKNLTNKISRQQKTRCK